MNSAVRSEIVTLEAADGHRLKGYLAQPAGAVLGSLVVVQEIFGVNGHIRRVCERYAQTGYVALAPALFDRIEAGVELAYDSEGMARGMELKRGVGHEKALVDVSAALAWLGGAEKAAVTGYCWGGSISWLAAAQLPIRAAVAYYGGEIGKFMDRELKAPVLAHFGERDKGIPLSVPEELRARHPTAVTHVYAAAEHGFNCDERASYHAEAAELARRRSLGFLAAIF
jgi:carboxymethylenebutenolidase